MSEPSTTPAGPGGDPDQVMPATVDAAVHRMLAMLPDEAKADIAAKSHDQLIELHFGLGTWIRNNFGLWQGNAALAQDAGSNDPDDIAGVIIKALWNQLRDAPKRNGSTDRKVTPVGGMKFTVSAYENSEIPDPRWIDEGSFDTADEAIRCAEAVIDRSLAELIRPGMNADDLRMSYLCYGEVPSIFNDKGLEFDAYAYVRKRIRALTGESEWRLET